VSLVSRYVHDEQGREVLSIGNRAATDPSLSLPSSEYAATARSLNSHVHLLQPEEPIPLEWSLYRMVTLCTYCQAIGQTNCSSRFPLSTLWGLFCVDRSADRQYPASNNYLQLPHEPFLAAEVLCRNQIPEVDAVLLCGKGSLAAATC
jgi:hypothetical protein